jgi:hypothetical protein
MRIEMLPNPSAAIVYQLAHQISTSLFGPEAVNFQRSANGTFEKLGGGQLAQPKQTFANGWDRRKMTR